ncbi:MAG: DUF2294 domain-containing protein [Spirochaetales bacterium]|nr:DUF2294 domain-containing protein [Spirochaetales bacterium]
MKKSKGQLEADISNAMIRFEKDFMGRGPDETRTFIIGDLVFVRLKGVLTAAEKKLANSADISQGRSLIKQVRIELIENAKDMLYAIIQDITNRVVVSLHTDISTVTGERIIIFTLDEEVDLAGC